MKVTVKLDEGMRLIGENSRQHQTIFDTVEELGGKNSAPTPVEVAVQSLGACTAMDVLSILRKKRKTINNFSITLHAERANEHPKVVTNVHLIYFLDSPDAEMKDLERAIELSQEKYCSVSAIFKKAGCEITWEAKLNS